MNRSFVSSMGALMVSAFAGASHAGPILINFDDIRLTAKVNFVDVGEHYNGGADSAGDIGPNLGVEFINFAVIDGKSTGYGFNSSPNFAFGTASGDHDIGDNIINVANGFSSLSFFFAAPEDTLVSVYSDLGRTNELASILIPANFDPTFFAQTVAFQGVARSIVFEGPSDVIGIDDLRLGAVPEPASWALMIMGFGLAGSWLRRQRTQAIPSA